jgi:D-serine deaminase-like pyridoxal phosphate-dependent protein
VTTGFTWTGTLLGPNGHLIGQPGSRSRLATPCLIVDSDAFETNLTQMSEYCAGSGVRLRPHAKTHKCAEIARRQIAAGADGLAVASIGEAEALSEAGITNLLITSPLALGSKVKRLAALLKAGAHVAVVTDSLEGVALLAKWAEAVDVRIPVFIDFDVGQHRTGATSTDAALDLADAIAAHANLELLGLQAYAGHIAHVASFETRWRAGQDIKQKVEEVLSALDEKGFSPLIVSGASTGSMFVDSKYSPFTELQCGSYIFMDAEYTPIDLDGRGRPIFQPSLFVRTSIVSKNWPGFATTDAGFKHFAGTALPIIYQGPKGVSRYEPTSDEHGRIVFDQDADDVALGDAIECMVPHCDPTVNLYDHLHVVRDDVLIDIWPIGARGAF